MLKQSLCISLPKVTCYSLFAMSFPRWLVGDMFPDSDIAKKYGTGKTKATQIMKGSLAPFFYGKVTTQCKH